MSAQMWEVGTTQLKRKLGVARRRLRERRDPGRSEIRRRVSDGLQLPSLPKRGVHRRPAVWAVLLVKNEEDILEFTLRHLVHQGVDGVLVVDNLSSDSTRDIAGALALEGLPIYLGRDSEPAHFQGEKITQMVQWARRAGASWVIPCDADELWFSREGMLADYLRASRATVEYASVFNVVPTRADLPVGSARGWVMGDQAATYRKVAFRSHRWARVEEGNHDVDRAGPRAAGLRVAHFPYRTPEQLFRKARSGAAAMAEIHPDIGGAHWRYLAGLPDSELLRAWQEIITGAADAELVGWVAEGNLHEVDVSAWTTWQLPGHQSL